MFLNGASVSDIYAKKSAHAYIFISGRREKKTGFTSNRPVFGASVHYIGCRKHYVMPQTGHWKERSVFIWDTASIVGEN